MYKAKLSIKETDWSGFAVKTGEPSSSIKEPYIIYIPNGDYFELQFAGNKYVVLVKEIGNGFVKLHTDNLLVKGKKNGTITHPEPFELILKLNEEIIYSTPTMDMGAKWQIKPLSIQEINSEENNASIDKTKGYKSNNKIKVPKVYFTETQDKIKILEEKLSTKIIVYYIPEKNWITEEQPDYFPELLNDIGHQNKISLVVHSTGGNPMACIRIASLLRSYCDTMEVIVPSYCMSAATQLALSANKILFTPLGFLSPIDAQITDIKDPRLTSYSYYQVSFGSFIKAHELLEREVSNKLDGKESESAYQTLFKYIHPLVYAEVDRLSNRSRMTAEMMMNMHPDTFENQEKIKWIANHLVYDYPNHDFPIQYNKAREIGLPVEMLSDEISHLLWFLLNYYKAITREAITFMHTRLYHKEEVSVLLETSNKRVIKRFSFNKQYFLSDKKWQVTHDNTQWIKLIPYADTNKPYKVIPLEEENIVKYDVQTEKNSDQGIEGNKS